MRVICEFLWCLNVSTVVVWVGEESGSSFLLGALYAILRLFRLGIVSRSGSSLTFWAMSLMLAIILFPLLLMLTSLSSRKRFLLVALAAIAVCALPFGFFFVRGVLLYGGWEAVFLFAETIGAFVCVVLYILQSRELHRIPPIVLLILHFCIWGGACHFFAGLVEVAHSDGLAVTFFRWMPFHLSLPILGLVSSTTSVEYARVSSVKADSQILKD